MIPHAQKAWSSSLFKKRRSPLTGSSAQTLFVAPCGRRTRTRVWPEQVNTSRGWAPRAAASNAALSLRHWSTVRTRTGRTGSRSRVRASMRALQGGYFTAGKRYQTSTLRISLRERNTVALMISCAPWFWLPGVLPALLMRSFAFALAGLCLGQPRLAEALLRGILWNIVQLLTSLDRRRSLVRCKAAEHEAARRFVHRPVLLQCYGGRGFRRSPQEGRGHEGYFYLARLLVDTCRWL